MDKMLSLKLSQSSIKNKNEESIETELPTGRNKGEYQIIQYPARRSKHM